MSTPHLHSHAPSSRRYHLLAAVALALLSLAACCHAPPAPQKAAPPAFGFSGLVHPHRRVLCVDLTTAQCAEVAKAVDKIDSAVGFELLRHPEAAKGTDQLDATEATLVFNDDEPNAEYWGATAPRSVTQPCWLGIVTINFNPLIWQASDLYEAVVLHELLHSVGGMHAAGDGETVFSSALTPDWRPGRPTELTPEDRAALRAAYPAER